MAVGFLLGIVFLLALIGCIIWASCSFTVGKSATGAIAVVLAIVCFITFIIVPFSIRTVDTGEIAVVKRFGEARDTRSSGMHYDFWMTNTYVRYDTKVQTVELKFSAYSADAQTMDVSMTLQYQIIPSKVIEIATQYGSLSVLQDRITSISVEKAKSVLSIDKAMDIIANRSQMSPSVERVIKEAVGDHYYVNIVASVLTDITFTDAFELAVEDKMIAEQNQLKAQYENEAKIAAAEADKQATIKNQEAKAEADKIAAQAKVDIATAEAEAIRIHAEAEAKALEINALEVARMLGLTEGTGTSEHIKDGLTVEEASLIADYIEYVKYLEVWDGKLPGVITDGSGIIISP
jgi:regulator of protease activity HflC (stomatin/prohibitin superfamily)